MSETASSVNADGIYEPFSIERVPGVEHSHGGRFGMRFRELGQYGGGRLTGEGYRKSATMDYWAGEDTGAT